MAKQFTLVQGESTELGLPSEYFQRRNRLKCNAIIHFVSAERRFQVSTFNAEIVRRATLLAIIFSCSLGVCTPNVYRR